MLEVMKDVQVVIHLAVLGLRQSIKDPLRVNQVVVDGTLNCLDAAVENGIELFVNCSSSEVYGTARRVPMSEDHPLRPETPYAAAKVAQDVYVHSYGRTYDLPWVTLRPFNMYGPNSHWQGYRGELIPKFIVRAMNQQPLLVFGDGTQSRDFIYVEDAARAFTAVLDKTDCRRTEVNVCTGRDTAIIDIAREVCRCFDIDPERGIETQPPRPGDVRQHLGDNRRCREQLGIEPVVALPEGIRKTVAWFASLPLSPEDLLAEETGRNWE
jgi:UDP-glucose 4-epimerase